MNFDDMQKIWDTQSRSPLFTLRESDLIRIVERKISATDRSVRWFEQGLILINLLVAGFMIMKAVRLTDPVRIALTLLFAAVALGITAYVWWSRERRLQRLKQFDQSLLGSLEAAIEDRAYLIRRGKRFALWYLMPFAVSMTLSIWYTARADNIWKWVLIGLLFIVAGYLPAWETRKVHLPQQKALESLRDLLLQEPPHEGDE